MIMRSNRNPLFDFYFYEISDFAASQKKNDSTISPKHNIIENDKEFVFEFILAGLNKEDISVNIDDNVLTVNAERKKIDDLKYIRHEIYFGRYEKKYELPDDVDCENIDVQYCDGILKIAVPKTNIKPILKKSFEIK